MKYKARILFFLSIILGVVIWALSPYLLGVDEPWDSPHYGYVNLLLFGIGLVLGAIGDVKPWLWPLGVFVGAFSYGLATLVKDAVFYSGGGVNLFIPLGVIFLVVFCLPVLIGSLAGSLVRKKLARA